MDKQYKDEINEVKDLGERIGYGNMMHIASVLWAMHISDETVRIPRVVVPPASKKAYCLKQREVIEADMQTFCAEYGVK